MNGSYATVEQEMGSDSRNWLQLGPDLRVLHLIPPLACQPSPPITYGPLTHGPRPYSPLNHGTLPYNPLTHGTLPYSHLTPIGLVVWLAGCANQQYSKLLR